MHREELFELMRKDTSSVCRSERSPTSAACVAVRCAKPSPQRFPLGEEPATDLSGDDHRGQGVHAVRLSWRSN